MKFAIYNQLGEITATGECPDGLEVNQVPAGMMLYLGEASTRDRVDVITGLLVPGAPYIPGYREMRMIAYPAVQVQLEALWHAMDRGEIPKAVEFYAMIKDIRDRHPKPEAFQTVEF